MARIHGEDGRFTEGVYDIETPEYQTWANMLYRCRTATAPQYPQYGDRGIGVCAAWESYGRFLRDMGKRPLGAASIERVDNSGNYEPANCRWATSKEQARNRRSNRMIEWRGRVMPMAAWAERVGLKYGVLQNRMRRGWSIDRALSQPMQSYRGRRVPCS